MVTTLFSRRQFQATSALGLLGLGACRRQPTVLSLYNWSDYLADEVVAAFIGSEAAAGRHVNVAQDLFASAAEMSSSVRAGAAYDLCVPLDILLEGLFQRGHLARLDLAKLPGVQHLDPSFPPWSGSKDDVFHAIPYLWGTTGIGYDAERIDPAPTSWSALYDARWKGHVTLLDSKGDVMDQALLAAGMYEGELDEARIRDIVGPNLIKQKSVLRGFDSTPGKALASGETWIAQIDSGDLLRAQESRPSLRYIVPDEGAVVWTDYMAVPASAHDPELALRFIQFLLGPEVAAVNANTLHYATPNRSALELGLIDNAKDPHVYPPPAVQKRLYPSRDWFSETSAILDELWLELRADYSNSSK